MAGLTTWPVPVAIAGRKEETDDEELKLIWFSWVTFLSRRRMIVIRSVQRPWSAMAICGIVLSTSSKRLSKARRCSLLIAFHPLIAFSKTLSAKNFEAADVVVVNKERAKPSPFGADAAHASQTLPNAASMAEHVASSAAEPLDSNASSNKKESEGNHVSKGTMPKVAKASMANEIRTRYHDNMMTTFTHRIS